MLLYKAMKESGWKGEVRLFEKDEQSTSCLIRKLSIQKTNINCCLFSLAVKDLRLLAWILRRGSFKCADK